MAGTAGWQPCLLLHAGIKVSLPHLSCAAACGALQAGAAAGGCRGGGACQEAGGRGTGGAGRRVVGGVVGVLCWAKLRDAADKAVSQKQLQRLCDCSWRGQDGLCPPAPESLMRCRCTAAALRMYRPCTAPVLPMYCPCTAPVLPCSWWRAKWSAAWLRLRPRQRQPQCWRHGCGSGAAVSSSPSALLLPHPRRFLCLTLSHAVVPTAAAALAGRLPTPCAVLPAPAKHPPTAPVLCMPRNCCPPPVNHCRLTGCSRSSASQRPQQRPRSAPACPHACLPLLL